MEKVLVKYVIFIYDNYIVVDIIYKENTKNKTFKTRRHEAASADTKNTKRKIRKHKDTMPLGRHTKGTQRFFSKADNAAK
jgi:hypothetical protein